MNPPGRSLCCFPSCPCVGHPAASTSQSHIAQQDIAWSTTMVKLLLSCLVPLVFIFPFHLSPSISLGLFPFLTRAFFLIQSTYIHVSHPGIYLNPVVLLLLISAHWFIPTILSQGKDQQCLEYSFCYLLGSIFAPCVPTVQVQLPTTEQATDSLRTSGILQRCAVSPGACLTCFVV